MQFHAPELLEGQGPKQKWDRMIWQQAVIHPVDFRSALCPVGAGIILWERELPPWPGPFKTRSLRDTCLLAGGQVADLSNGLTSRPFDFMIHVTGHVTGNMMLIC